MPPSPHPPYLLCSSRSNLLGTHFTIFDNGSNPSVKRGSGSGSAGGGNGGSSSGGGVSAAPSTTCPRRELSAVVYVSNGMNAVALCCYAKKHTLAVIGPVLFVTFYQVSLGMDISYYGTAHPEFKFICFFKS